MRSTYFFGDVGVLKRMSPALGSCLPRFEWRQTPNSLLADDVEEIRCGRAVENMVLWLNLAAKVLLFCVVVSVWIQVNSAGADSSLRLVQVDVDVVLEPCADVLYVCYVILVYG